MASSELLGRTLYTIEGAGWREVPATDDAGSGAAPGPPQGVNRLPDPAPPT